MGEAEFDEFAVDYTRILNRAISISGEDSAYFARRRVRWLSGWLDARQFECQSVMDFGCGTGIGVKFLQELLQPKRVLGVDVSEVSLEVAAGVFSDPSVCFVPVDQHQPQGDHDLVYSNGVVHHIAPDQRQEAFGYMRDSLRPGGICAIWENNPWSLPARYCMRMNSFDRNAEMVSARGVRSLCAAVGLRVLSTHYLFVFPRQLSKLRFAEKHLARLPLGAQFLVLSTRA